MVILEQRARDQRQKNEEKSNGQFMTNINFVYVANVLQFVFNYSQRSVNWIINNKRNVTFIAYCHCNKG
jgi:hypothetical protein